MRSSHFAALATVALLAVGCGVEEPEIINATVSPNPAAAGAAVTFSLTIEDDQGFDDFSVNARLLRPTPSALETPDLPQPPDGAQGLLVQLVLQLLPSAPAGDYTFEFVAVDGDGNNSEPAEVDLVVQ